MTLDTDTHLKKIGLPKAELVKLGFRLLVDAISPVLALHRALRECYQAIADWNTERLFGTEGLKSEQESLHRTIGLERMLAVERETVER
jgi:hypothetical protein